METFEASKSNVTQLEEVNQWSNVFGYIVFTN